MSYPKYPLPCKMVVGIIYSPGADLTSVRQAITERLGSVEIVSEVFPFSHTGYYAEEMGSELQRIFYVFEGLYEREYLIDAKMMSYDMEREYTKGGGRTVNVDPGILTLENFVLATFKNYYHRIYLGKGVYGEVTLYYSKEEYRELPWTYPDYRDVKVKNFFKETRGYLYNKTIGAGMRHGTEYDGVR